MKVLRIAAFVVSACLASATQAETRLLMAEEHGCYWCERWTEEIGDIYPKTAEGEAAPLERYDLYGDAPEDVIFAKRVLFTPTFILVDNGQEVGRIEGYPGEDFFWGLLGMLFQQADIPLDPTG